MRMFHLGRWALGIGLFLALLFVALLSGCNSNSNSVVVSTLTISPLSADVGTGGTQTFVATSTEESNKAVTWHVSEGAAGGTIVSIDQNHAIYTAPNTPGTYHVIAVSVANTNLSATAVVNVRNPSLFITPQTAILATGGMQTFSATVRELSNNAVTWTVQEGAAGGSIVPTGDDFATYTAPNTAGTYHVVVTSVADPGLSAIATVTVQAAPPTLTISPPTPTLPTGGSQLFTATLTGETNTTVTWVVQEVNGGTIVANGHSATYTAPNTAGTYHVMVTSMADMALNAIATVTVTAANNAAVTINNFQFTPQQITVAAGTNVQWTNQEAGVAHTVTADATDATLGGPDSDIQYPSGVPSGSTYSWTVPANAASGTVWYYHCRFHGAEGNGTSLGAGMSGSVTVR